MDQARNYIDKNKSCDNIKCENLVKKTKSLIWGYLKATENDLCV